MDEDDDGMFHYNAHYPPLFVQPTENQIPALRRVMQTAVSEYLQHSYRHGRVLHESTVLESGLTAAEAGVVFFREAGQHRRMVQGHSGGAGTLSCRQRWNTKMAMECIQDALRDHLDIVIDRTNRTQFYRYVTHDIFQSAHIEKQLTAALNCFLDRANLKSKGYTKRLARAVEQVQRNLEELE